MSSKEIYRDKLLKKTIVYAYNHSPFYRWLYKQHNIDINSFAGYDNYDSLPILRKEDILSFARVYSIEEAWCRSYTGKLITTSTSGTSGARLTIPVTPNNLLTFLMKPLTDALHWWGYQQGPINTILWEPLPDPRPSLVSGISVVLETIAEISGGKVYVAPFNQAKEGKLEGQIAKGQTLAHPGNLYFSRKYLSSPFHKEVLRKLNVKYLLTFVTPLEVNQRLHTKIRADHPEFYLIPYYGSAEMHFVGFSCPYTFDNAYVHITQREAVFHIIDPNTDSLSEEGTGELVYTSIGREMFPFIKYSTGDIVTLKKTDICGCGYSGQSLRFESRPSLTVKIESPDGYFIDILEVEKIVKEVIPGSQVICIYGEHPYEHFFYLAIFIGVSGPIREPEEALKDEIIRRIVVSHVPSYGAEKVFSSDFISKWALKWQQMFPIFFIDISDIPIESTANKPKLLLNLMDEKNLLLLRSSLYRNISSKIEDYLR